MVAHIVIPTLYTDPKTRTPQDYQIQEVILGKPTKDAPKALTTLGLKQVVQQLEQGEELQVLRRQIDILRGLVKEDKVTNEDVRYLNDDAFLVKLDALISLK